jgi:hypothetical protein
MKSPNSYSKKKRAEEKAKKRVEKLKERLERNKNPKRDFNDMIAYVDINGNICDEPPADDTIEINNTNK